MTSPCQKMNTKTHFKILLIYLTASTAANALFSNSLKKLKQKAKNAYKKKFGKDKSWHFLGYDLTEYPGTNERYREINKEKWEDYYKCLSEQHANLGEGLSITPEAVQGFETSSITMECKLCLSPMESAKIDSVEWDWAPPHGKKLEAVEYTEHVLLSPEDRTLIIYNLQKEHTGQYMCRIGEAQAPPYFLTVVSPPDEDLKEVHSEDAALGPYPTKPERIGDTNLMLDLEWGPWTACSKCGQIGRRHRMGYCIITYEEKISKRNSETNQTSASPKHVKIDQKYFELLKIFKFGIPCDSHILPNSIRNLEQVRNRKSEVMTGFCKIDCPVNKIFEVKDKNGNVIERANNSAGIYSMSQGLPPVDPPVERRLEYAEKGKKVVLTCPGNLNDDAPVQWQIGSKNIVPELLVKESKGRIYISITDKIHFKKAHVSDSNIYSCWQHQELAGTIRLIVEERVSLDFNHHIMLFGMVLILLVFLRVFVKAFFGRKAVKSAKK